MSEERKYAVLSTESIKLIAESAGFNGLPEDIAAALAEDVTYRLREAAQSSVQFMKHGRRKKLTHEDFNRALRWSDVEPICGGNLKDIRAFRHNKDADVYFIDDREISLADVSLDIKHPQNNGEASVQAQWIAFEGVNKVNSLSKTSSVTLGPTLTDPLSEYYVHITQACLGKDEEAMKVALADLRSNSKIGSLLPFLLNFVSSNLSKVSHSLTQINKMLHILQSLVNNQSLFLGPYLNVLVTSLVHCMLEPLTASLNPLNDHWLLRDYASLILAKTLRSLELHAESIHQQLGAMFEQVFTDPLRSLCSQYGAIMGLTVLGPQALESILLPNMAPYMPSLFMFLQDTSVSNYSNQNDARKVLGALQVAADLLLHSKLTTDVFLEPSSPLLSPCSSSSPDVDKQTDPLIGQGSSGNKHANLYRTFSEYFGDSFSNTMNASVGVQHWLRQEEKQIAPMEMYKLKNKLRLKVSEDKKHNSTRKQNRYNHKRCIEDSFIVNRNIKVRNMNINLSIEFCVDGFKPRLPFLLKKRNVSKNLMAYTLESSKFAILNKQMKVFGKRRGLSSYKNPLDIPNVWVGDIW
ncbi:TAF6-like RNA polymerase II p300/CBP-associated factor-associated factor 65 kDa subunit 6L [Antedon mediterranea]|uniref:TAF6-like RNA polymerase II p300/CBP-associated factor-associated factor 65 kDa subunit 6L n=1 Tax=Antedon mediterranea TaxID=105859 RepID=UPI003AF6F9A5